jgi:hypothetical protein
MKIFGSEFFNRSWDIDPGWIGSYLWYNMENCSGKN